ncbi:MAG: hypothetical protein DRI01_06370 [Chloroflexi bacterium]|nr:MAG: hypothetical protein DRI01_06370 [Chloroflexota bacterium]
MFFFPVGCLLLGLFILFFPVMLMLFFFNVISFSFSRLGISPQLAVLLLFLTLAGSVINIPVTRRTVEYSRGLGFGWFEIPIRRESGLAINLGGAIVPTILAIYLLFRAPLLATLIATAVMIVICKFLTRPIPGQGLAIPMLIPPVLATLLAVLLAGEQAPLVAYISGVLGTLIGGDLLNLSKARRLGAGIVSIGGAGVFDGIFLVGVFSVTLTAIYLPPSPLQLPTY